MTTPLRPQSAEQPRAALVRELASDLAYSVAPWAGRSPEFMQAKLVQWANKIQEFAEAYARAVAPQALDPLTCPHCGFKHEYESCPMRCRSRCPATARE